MPRRFRGATAEIAKPIVPARLFGHVARLTGVRANPSGPSMVHIEGLQLDFPAQQTQGVAEVWVPFEVSIAIGW
jgi:hypothetical protein